MLKCDLDPYLSRHGLMFDWLKPGKAKDEKLEFSQNRGQRRRARREKKRNFKKDKRKIKEGRNSRNDKGEKMTNKARG